MGAIGQEDCKEYLFSLSSSLLNINEELFTVPELLSLNGNGVVRALSKSFFPKVNGLLDDAFPCNPPKAVFGLMLVVDSRSKRKLDLGTFKVFFDPSDSFAAPQAMQTVVHSSFEIKQIEHDQETGFGASFANESKLFLLVPAAVDSCNKAVLDVLLVVD